MSPPPKCLHLWYNFLLSGRSCRNYTIRMSWSRSGVVFSAACDKTQGRFVMKRGGRRLPSGSTLSLNCSTILFSTQGHPCFRVTPPPCSCWVIIPTLHQADPNTHTQPLPAAQISQGDRTNKHQLVGYKVPGRLQWCHRLTFCKRTGREITRRICI